MSFVVGGEALLPAAQAARLPGGPHDLLSSFTTSLSAAVPPGTFFSPASIQLALALVAAGGAGQTLAQLQAVLGFPTSANWQQELGTAFSPLHAAVAAGEPVLAVANRVYVRPIVPLKPTYVQAVQSVFGASIEALASAAQVNGFVKEATRGMIEELITDDAVAQSVLIAVNALYFKGKWAVRFSETETRRERFATAPAGAPAECHMMKTPAGQKWQYHEDERAQYVLLAYKDGAGGESTLGCGGRCVLFGGRFD
jgi:serine protease inhibitor